MYVGIAKISLVIGDSHSLKDKRMVLRRIKDRVRERIGVTINEVGEQDTWQRAELGCALVSSERAKAHELLDEVTRVAMAAGGGQIVAIAKDVITYEGESVPYTPIDDRTGSGDKAQAADPDWVPDAWREDHS
jgi:hypothetical protein